jgi:hypothetical protein
MPCDLYDRASVCAQYLYHIECLPVFDPLVQLMNCAVSLLLLSVPHRPCPKALCGVGHVVMPNGVVCSSLVQPLCNVSVLV